MLEITLCQRSVYEYDQAVSRQLSGQAGIRPRWSGANRRGDLET